MISYLQYQNKVWKFDELHYELLIYIHYENLLYSNEERKYLAMKQVKKTPKITEKSSVNSNVIENNNKYGVIKIYENVIIEVIRKAACSVNGVTKLAGGTFVDSIANLIGSHRTSDNGISINIDGNVLTTEVKVNMLYGEHIPEVAARVQNTISDEVKRIAGLNVARVDVIIQEIEHIQETEKTD